MSNTTNNLGISQNGIPIFDNATGLFTNTIPPADQLLVGDANSQIIGVDPTGFAVGSPLCSAGVGVAPTYSTSPTVASITIQNLPANNTDGANKAYVDSVASGITFIDSTIVATTANLTALYNNGIAGVGATLTNNGVQAALSIDGQALSLNDRVLVKDQTAQEENGVYEVTVVGSGATNWVLTRTTDYDQPAEIIAGSIVSVLLGTVNGQTFWAETQNIANIGTDPIIYIAFNSVPNNVLISTNNLSDVASAATSRSNLGLTAVATQTVTQHSLLAGGAANSIVSLPVGTAGQALISNGPGVDPSFQTLGNGFSQIVTQVFAASGTYTPTANMKYCIVEVVGGGGGGGGADAGTSTGCAAASGGGAGGYARKTFSAATIGASQTVTIGAGGAGGAVGNNNGTDGNTTTFGALLQASGGKKGIGSASPTNPITLGGSGGVGTLGDFNTTGQAGGVGFGYGRPSGVTSGMGTAYSGFGGASYFGGGGSSVINSPSISSNGIAGSSYGSGGSGGVTFLSKPAASGGAGASGVCVVTEYI